MPSPKVRPMFPHAVDSTIMAAFATCPRKAYLEYILHWKPKTQSVHLVAGAAFAAGVEAARRGFWEQGLPPAEAEAQGLAALFKAYGNFECPPESAKSLERTAGALEFYFEQYPLGQDGMEPLLLPSGRRAIEFSFALPLDFAHPVTGDPILYTGRADAIVNFAGGLYNVDEKTTSSLGPSWSRQWEHRPQFTGYSWAARESGIAVQGTIIRGVSILKTKYDTQQAMTYRSDWEIERWMEQTLRDLGRMKEAWDSGWWDFNFTSCMDYGGCPFSQVCKSPEPQRWLETYFEQRVWDPLLRKEVSVEEYEKSWGHESAGIIKL